MTRAPAAKAPAAPEVHRTRIEIEHVRIVSNKPYAAVLAAMADVPRFDDRIRALLHEGEFARVRTELEKNQSDVGLTIFSTAMHGDWLQIVSGPRNAVQYVIGNVLVATQMTRHGLMAGLYAPLRVMLYENDAGTATFEYDLPSTLFGQFGNDSITAVAKDLDHTIQRVLLKAAN